MAIGDNGAGEGGMLDDQIVVQAGDGGQPPVNGAGLEPFVCLDLDKLVDMAIGDCFNGDVSDGGNKQIEVVLVVSPSAGGGAAAAHPMNKLRNFG